MCSSYCGVSAIERDSPGCKRLLLLFVEMLEIDPGNLGDYLREILIDIVG